MLRGPAIRELAVRVLLDQPEAIDALHYRRWYEILVDGEDLLDGVDDHADGLQADIDDDDLALFGHRLTRTARRAARVRGHQ